MSEGAHTNDDGSCAIPPPTPQPYVPSLYERVRMRARVDPPASHMTVPGEVLAAIEQMKRHRCGGDDDKDDDECEPAAQRRCPQTAGVSLHTNPEQGAKGAVKRAREKEGSSCSEESVEMLEHKRVKTGAVG